jgi:hypothetical protein
MKYSRLQNRLRLACALLATTLFLPVMAYAGTDNGKGNNGNQNGHDKIPVVPEANAGWVLIPFFGAVLLYSWRQFSRPKAKLSRRWLTIIPREKYFIRNLFYRFAIHPWF